MPSVVSLTDFRMEGREVVEEGVGSGVVWDRCAAARPPPPAPSADRTAYFVPRTCHCGLQHPKAWGQRCRPASSASLVGAPPQRGASRR